MIRLLIDGYNLLHRQRKMPINFGSLEHQRDELLEKLHRYQSEKNVEITIVFDGSHEAGLFPRRDRYGSIDILFSQGDESADDVMMAECERNPGGYVVVTSDNQILSAARYHNCLTLKSDEFLARLKVVSDPRRDDPYFEDKLDEESESIPLYPRVSTKKKGAAKKLPKRERKKAHQLKNL